ncbi:MAG: hypothetical protein H0U64_06800 [Gemmatimonadaceae bacterium]|nr:hypothetical protein [Gemmatimonadaceae bacterium]
MRIAVARRNEMLDSIRDNLATGKLRIYAGTRPTDADTALASNTLLAELVFSAIAFPAASAGVITANAITQDSSADATGTASFARLFETDGTTVVCDLSVGVSASEINFQTLSFAIGLIVQVTSLTISLPVGT